MSASDEKRALEDSLKKDIKKVSTLKDRMDTHGKLFELAEAEPFNAVSSVLDELESIRDQAQELAPALCLRKEKPSSEVEHQCELVIQRYHRFLGTTQGQAYRTSLIEFDKAELAYLRKSFHVEHKRDILEQKRPNYNLRHLFAEGLCENFWDQLGSACRSFLDGPRVDDFGDEAQITELEVYARLMDKDKKVSTNPRTRYLAIFSAFELLNRYLSVNKQEVSHTLYNQVLSLSHAGRHLIDYYILIEGIVGSAPIQDVDGERYSIIKHPDDFIRLEGAKLRHHPEWAAAIQELATNYGKLLKFDASSNIVPMIELPRLTDRKKRYY